MHGLIAADVDITDREASDERFCILFERSSNAHLLLDETGVIDCNDASLRMLRGVRKPEVVGRGSAELSPPRQPDGRLSEVVAAQMLQRARPWLPSLRMDVPAQGVRKGWGVRCGG